jgi:hypothetical protein
MSSWSPHFARPIPGMTRTIVEEIDDSVFVADALGNVRETSEAENKTLNTDGTNMQAIAIETAENRRAYAGDDPGTRSAKKRRRTP